MNTGKLKDFLPIRKNFSKLFGLLSLFSGPDSLLRNLFNITNLARLPITGDRTQIKGKVYLKHPEFIYLGSDVTLEARVALEGRGGIVVCDGVTVKKNTAIITTGSRGTGPQPVFLDVNQSVNQNLSHTPRTPLPTSRFRHPASYKTTALVKGKNIFFILSTGRAGSTSIAAILNQHPDITCLHEPNRLLIRLSTEYAHGQKTKAEAREELLYYYTKTSLFPGVVYGESDHKLFNLVEILAEILPEAKFIWLIRHARKFVPSVYGRKWFQDYPTIGEKSVIEQDIYRYRINGYRCGSFTEQEWENMAVFEKVCWYWAYWNAKIESQLLTLPNHRWCFVQLETLEEKIPELLQFLQATPMKLEPKRQNKANYHTLKPQHWDAEKQAAYHQWCQPYMNKWYPVASQSLTK